jgi:hypothetical protein
VTNQRTTEINSILGIHHRIACPACLDGLILGDPLSLIRFIEVCSDDSTRAFGRSLRPENDLSPGAVAMAQYFLDLVYTLTNCFSCFPGSPQLKINNRSFKILRLLGEVSVGATPISSQHANGVSAGRILLRLSGTGYE